jgi:hypothetical protein
MQPKHECRKFSKIQEAEESGTIKYCTWCILCKADYNNTYMRRRREDPEFREKEKAYHATHIRNHSTNN